MFADLGHFNVRAVQVHMFAPLFFAGICCPFDMSRNGYAQVMRLRFPLYNINSNQFILFSDQLQLRSISSGVSSLYWASCVPA
jgi:hypothetical protein